MITPAFLKPNDTVGIVSTARKLSEDALKPAVSLLKEWGLRVRYGKSIGAEAAQFAGSDELRRADLQQLLDDPEIQAIWCARGGYGTVRIIDGLDFTAFKKKPKWIIGYSDITVLHSHLQTFGIETLHAQMPFEIETKSAETTASIKKTIFGEPYQICAPSEGANNRTGIASGKLVGGNLSVLYSLCGSPSAIKTDGKILFIEDLDEYLYHIDRMLQNLKRNGLFNNLKGLIVGGMSQMRDNTIPFGSTAEEIVRDIVSEYDFPVCFHFPAGHVKDNRALILGREVILIVSEKEIELKF